MSSVKLHGQVLSAATRRETRTVLNDIQRDLTELRTQLAALRVDVSAVKTAHDGHTHGGVTTGAGNTAAATASAALTSATPAALNLTP